jgi:hypothetical protein
MSDISYNVNNPKPLINREQNYVLDRKLVSIHSEDRDITKYPYPNLFSITLPQHLLNVQSLRLVQTTFPLKFYTFSNEYHNTKFRFTYNNEYYCVQIQEGSYIPCQLAIELTNVMNNAVGSIIFNVFYDVVGNKFWFGATAEFILDFDCKMEYPEAVCNTTPIWFQYAKWGLPYYLGYKKKQYVAEFGNIPLINYLNLTDPSDPASDITWMVTPESNVINIDGEKDIYMEVDKYNSYDEVYPYTESDKSSYSNNANTGNVDSAFAKIPIENVTIQDSRNLTLINFVQYEPPIERISKLSFKFRFHDGRLVDFRGLEFSFTIEFNMLRSEILRNKNVRIPAMLQL